MTSALVKPLAVHFTAILILSGGFYALVIYPFVLDDLVKGAIISLMTLAAKAIFDDQQASRAFDAALNTPPPQTTTVLAQPPSTVIVNEDPNQPVTGSRGSNLP